MFQFLSFIIKGFCMGAADVVPGVSGGTMAFILGIYERLLQALKSLDFTALKLFFTLKWKELFRHVDWKILLGLGIGIIGAIFFFTHIVSLPHLLETQKARVYAYFFGLVFATVALLLWRYHTGKLRNLLLLAAGVAAGYALMSLGAHHLPNSYPAIFAGGAIAICAMLLPGISGSYILLILGQYQAILYAVSEHIWEVVGVFLAGAVVGMLAFVRLLIALLKRWHDETLFFISGLIIGTLPQLWPLQYIRDGSLPELQWVGGLIGAGMLTIGIIFLLQKRIGQ